MAAAAFQVKPVERRAAQPCAGESRRGSPIEEKGKNMSTALAYPVRVEGKRDPHLSRWL